MGKKPRNWVGEAVVWLPKPIRKHVKPLVKQGQIRSKRGQHDFREKIGTFVFGKKKGGRRQ